MSIQKTLKELADLTGAELLGPPDIIISGVNALSSAGPDAISFLADKKLRPQLAATQAGAVVIFPDISYDRPRLVSRRPYQDFIKIVDVFAPVTPWPEPGIHNQAVVDPGAKLGKNVTVGPFCVVGAGVELGEGTKLAAQVFVGENTVIGRDCQIFPGVVLRERISLGDRVIIHPGAVVGADGFGFLPEGDHYTKIPQIGTVVIEDDVEIGANVTIDRAALGETRIGRGSKLDNLIMIAHNVVIGPDTMMAGQSGISGSTQLGRHVMVGGQAGIGGHLEIGDGAILGGQSGVMGNIKAGEFVSGYPAQPHPKAMRQLGEISRLPELRKKVKELEARLQRLESE